MAENKLSSLISLFDEECDEEFAEESVEVESNATPPISQPRQSGSSVGFQFTSSAPAVIQTSSSCKAFDPDFGVRVSNPRISLETANAYCSGMIKVRISQLQPTSIPADEWATMAVIVEKSESRKSAKNNEYMIWKASDLINPQVEPCRLLLFGDCVKKHWKLQIGTVVIITNAQLADSTMESKGTALKIFKATQALEIGFCPDFGHCKAIKLDGEKCTKFVNVSKSENCAHHILSAARRLSANRGVFSSPKANNWRLKKDDLPESSMGLITVKRDSNKQFVNPNNFHAKRALKGKDDKSLIPKSRVPPYPAIKMNSPKPANGQAPAKPSPQNPRLMLSQMAPKSMKEFILQESNRPKLASKAERGSPLINLASPEKKKSRLTVNEELKIKRAVAILKNSSSNRSGPPSSSIKQPGAPEKVEASPTSKGTLLGGTFSDDQIKAMLRKRSKHADEVAQVDKEKENQYFDNREAEEKVETSATTLMEIKNYKVVTCKECDYTSMYQSSYCKSQSHEIKKHTADKRFFKCKDCGQKIFCFQILPTAPCRRCSGKSYERVAMKAERKIKGEKLLLRGEERKFIS